MLITDDHREWVTVDRWRQLLDRHDPEFDVTHCFAIYSAIVCWVVQRARDGSRPLSLHAFKDEAMLGNEPWCISAPRACLTAFWYFVGMRNAIAHMDDRKVQPLNRGNCLTGYRFKADAHTPKNEGRKLVWSGTIDLTAKEMSRQGRILAAEFCDAIAKRNGSNFSDDVSQLRLAA